MGIIKARKMQDESAPAAARDLSTALQMKRKPKFAKGGRVPDSAASEARPMPSEKAADSTMTNQQKTKGAQPVAFTTESRAVVAPKPKMQAISRPKMAGSDVFSVRDRDRVHDEEEHLLSKDSPDGIMDDVPEKDETKLMAPLKGGIDKQKPHSMMMAEGGMVDSDEDEIEHAASIAAAIMAKRAAAKMMAEGGMVDIEENEMEQPNGYDKRNAAILKEHYGEEGHDDPMDSNEMGDSAEDDSENIDDASIADAIRRKMKMKSAMTK